MTKEKNMCLKQALQFLAILCVISIPTVAAFLTSQAVAQSRPPERILNSNSYNGCTTDRYALDQSHYFTVTGLEFWDDFEITNEWHTIATQGTNDYQAAVVYSNYFVKIIFEDRTNKVQLSSTLLPLDKVPMRIVPAPIIYHSTNQIIVQPSSPWYKYLTPNVEFYNPT